MSYLETSLSSVTGESGGVLHAVAERMMSAPKVRKLISRKLSILQHGVIHRVGTSLVRPLFTEPALVSVTFPQACDDLHVCNGNGGHHASIVVRDLLGHA